MSDFDVEYTLYFTEHILTFYVQHFEIQKNLELSYVINNLAEYIGSIKEKLNLADSEVSFLNDCVEKKITANDHLSNIVKNYIRQFSNEPISVWHIFDGSNFVRLNENDSKLMDLELASGNITKIKVCTSESLAEIEDRVRKYYNVYRLLSCPADCDKCDNKNFFVRNYLLSEKCQKGVLLNQIMSGYKKDVLMELDEQKKKNVKEKRGISVNSYTYNNKIFENNIYGYQDLNREILRKIDVKEIFYQDSFFNIHFREDYLNFAIRSLGVEVKTKFNDIESYIESYGYSLDQAFYYFYTQKDLVVDGKKDLRLFFKSEDKNIFIYNVNDLLDCIYKNDQASQKCIELANDSTCTIYIDTFFNPLINSRTFDCSNITLYFAILFYKYRKQFVLVSQKESDFKIIELSSNLYNELHKFDSLVDERYLYVKTTLECQSEFDNIEFVDISTFDFDINYNALVYYSFKLSDGEILKYKSLEIPVCNCAHLDYIRQVISNFYLYPNSDTKVMFEDLKDFLIKGKTLLIANTLGFAPYEKIVSLVESNSDILDIYLESSKVISLKESLFNYAGIVGTLFDICENLIKQDANFFRKFVLSDTYSKIVKKAVNSSKENECEYDKSYKNALVIFKSILDHLEKEASR